VEDLLEGCEVEGLDGFEQFGPRHREVLADALRDGASGLREFAVEQFLEHRDARAALRPGTRAGLEGRHVERGLDGGPVRTEAVDR
jgi:hypothetical protein